MVEQAEHRLARATDAEELLFRAALLAGMGARSRAVAQATCSNLNNSTNLCGPQRSCVDAGRPLMLSVRTPGVRSLRVLLRVAAPTPNDGISHWLRLHYNDTGACERWATAAFLRNPRQAWEQALALARQVRGEAVFRRYHAALGPRGQIFSVSRLLDHEEPGGFVTWQLDRYSSPEEALAACEAGSAWQSAVQVLRQLFGRYVSHRTASWSISWNLSADRTRVRLGTTYWLIGPEDALKRRRFADTVAALGGDGRFAEALYKLIATSEPGGLTKRIGRAVEVELCEDGVLALEGYLSCCPASAD